MKYYLQESEGSVLQGSLTNETGRTVYYYDSDQKVMPGLRLFYNDVEIGQAKTEYGELDKYAIFTGKKKVDRLITLGRFFLTRLVLETAGWQVSGEYLELNFQILSRRKTVMATVSDNGHVIEILDEDNELKLLLMILAVILFRSTFKKR